MQISFEARMKEHGWAIFPDFLDMPMVNRMRDDLENAYRHCMRIQIVSGLNNTEGTCHHIIGQGQSFLDYLTKFEELNEYVEAYFGGKYILNSFGGNILQKDSSYANKIHRDIRSYSGSLPLLLNTLVMLDDFTEANGATWLMNGGHQWPVEPTQEDFDKRKFQITGKAGTVVFWNSNLWHAAGENTTDTPRRSVTPMFSRPFFKPQFDYPRALGYWSGDSYSPYLQQVLGYNSRIPKDLHEWYQQKDKRMYRSDQG